MQLQPQTPPIRGRRERREGEHTDPRPETAERSLETVIADMRQRGADEVTDAKTLIAQAHAAAERARAKTAKKDLATLEAEVDEAWNELQNTTNEVRATTIAQAPSGDLDWDIPEPANAEIKELSDQEKEHADQLALAIITAVFEKAPADLQRLKQLLELPIARDAAEAVLRSRTEDLINAQTCPFGDLESIVTFSRLHPELRTATQEVLSDRISKKYAEQILTSQEFRSTLGELHASLEGTLGTDGPKLCAERGLREIVIIHEVMGLGARRVSDAMDLSHYSDELSFLPNQESALKITEAYFDPKSGELLEGDVTFSTKYTSTDPNQNGEVVRIFKRRLKSAPENRMMRDSENEIETIRSVEHNSIKIPNSIKGGGAVLRMTEMAITEYDRMELDAITLRANIDIGGYSWASYGYGWDEEAMVNAQPRNIDKNVKMETEMFLKSVSDFSRKAKERIENILPDVDSNPELTRAVEKILQTFDNMIDHPENVTPQSIAVLGADGPQFHRGNSGTWYEASTFKQALKDGVETEEYVDEFGSQLKGPLHVGKIALINSEWYGKIELKKDGTQNGKNRKLLEATLNRRK